MLSRVSGFNKKMAVYKMGYEAVDTTKYDLNLDDVIVKSSNKPIVKANYFTIKSKAYVNQEHPVLCVKQIHSTNDFSFNIRGYLKNIKFLTSSRKYNVALSVKSRKKTYQEIHLPRKAKTIKIRYADIEIRKKIKTTDEIVQLMPYVKNLEKKKLYRIPIIKIPVSKSYFSIQEMDRFKSEMAKQSGTRKSNIEVLTIYDKFNFSIYSELIPSSKDNSIACYPSFKAEKITNDDLYYLILGRKINTKKPIKSLIKM